MRPDEAVFRAHLEDGRFISGAEARRWRLIHVAWPHAYVAVSAVARRAAPDEFAFRFELTDYPRTLPNAQPWDVEGQAPLAVDLWPAGDSHVGRAFNPGWNTSALYLPFDRLALPGHDAWLNLAPSDRWDYQIGITQYLRRIHELLNSPQYRGIRRSPA